MESDIHEAFLQHEDLIESEAENQGAWLTESAGALADLHAPVLKSLCRFWPVDACASNSRKEVGAEDSRDTFGARRLTTAPNHEEGESWMREARASRTSYSKHTAEEAKLGNETEDIHETPRNEQERGWLNDLGRVLARKRQFNASRQVVNVVKRFQYVTPNYSDHLTVAHFFIQSKDEYMVTSGWLRYG